MSSCICEKYHYQLGQMLYLSVTSHINCTVARWHDKRRLSHSLYNVSSSGQHHVALFEWHRGWRWIDPKNNICVRIASFKSEPTFKLIIEYKVCVLWSQVCQAQLWECMPNCTASLAIQQVFSKPCLVNLISKDTHLLSCQPRVTVTSCFVYKVIRDLWSIDYLCFNPILQIGLIRKWSIDSR